MKNIQDIIPDREIIKMQNEEFAGIKYESWEVETPVWSDQVETLLENGFMVSMIKPNIVTVNKPMNISCSDLSSNKQFWRDLNEAVN